MKQAGIEALSIGIRKIYSEKSPFINTRKCISHQSFESLDKVSDKRATTAKARRVRRYAAINHALQLRPY